MPTDRPTRAQINDAMLPLRLAGLGPYAIVAYLRQLWPCEDFTVVADRHVIWMQPDAHLDCVPVC
jgi:hypothetical protein